MTNPSVLDTENQHLVREAYCWTAELEQRRDSEYHYERCRPFVLLKPKLFFDGNQWCALYGDNIQDGLAGFGDSPAAASTAFDEAFQAKLPQQSRQASERAK